MDTIIKYLEEIYKEEKRLETTYRLLKEQKMTGIPQDLLLFVLKKGKLNEKTLQKNHIFLAKHLKDIASNYKKYCDAPASCSVIKNKNLKLFRDKKLQLIYRIGGNYGDYLFSPVDSMVYEFSIELQAFTIFWKEIGVKSRSKGIMWKPMDYKKWMKYIEKVA